MSRSQEVKTLMNETHNFLKALRCPKAQELSLKISNLIKDYEQHCPAAHQKTCSNEQCPCDPKECGVVCCKESCECEKLLPSE